ncbi:YwqG family protein [Tahibacter amnicola]|uniref:YwqG family protein n=1 Tax=Tahibacter amnicola TaxID=2976241 RepID=A0ABY6BCZ9_9GAMM|nr:YwqG family protein [Tahibacter amnicola]UXI66995.1 YwqG family protein [Tahibacter amnicola]
MSIHSNLRETVISLSDGSQLLITLDRREDYYAAIRDTSLSYAWLLPPDGGPRRDLLGVLSNSLVPDRAKSRHARELAAAQRHAARNRSGREKQRCLDNATRHDWEAGQYAMFSRGMPHAVAELAPGVLIAGFDWGRPNARFRCIDILREQALFDIDGPELDRLFGNIRYFRRSAEERSLLDSVRQQHPELRAHLPPSGGMLPSRTYLVTAHREYALFLLGGLGLVLTCWSEGRLKPLHALQLGHYYRHRSAVFCRNQLIALGCRHTDRHASLHVIDPVSGETRHSIAFEPSWIPDSVVGCDATGMIALSGSGGRVRLLELDTLATRDLAACRGLGKEYSADLALSPDGRWLLATAHLGVMTLTDLRDLRSVELPLPEAERREPADYSTFPTPLIRIAGYYLDSTQVGHLHSGHIHVQSIDSLAFRPGAPDVPLPPLKAPHDAVNHALTLGFSALADCLRRWVRQPCQLSVKAVHDEIPELGTTRVGGYPDLPIGTRWPRHNGRPMQCLAQIDLSDLPGTLAASGFPATGLLTFFIALEPDLPTARFHDPDQSPGNVRVLYTPEGTPLERIRSTWDRGTPAADIVMPSCAARFATLPIDLPAIDSARVRQARLSPGERDLYAELLEHLHAVAPGHRYHFIGGNARLIQCGDPADEAERIVRGIDRYQLQIDDPALAADVLRASTDWVQLAQFDSCSEAGWEWGDGGVLHWMIREDDLRHGCFDRVIMTFECH